MRRFYVLAIATMSAYCLTDAFASNGGEATDRIGTPTFSADLINLPVIDKHETVGVNEAVATNAQAESALDTVSAQPAVHPTPVAALRAPNKVRTVAAAPRVIHHHTSKADAFARSARLSTPVEVAPAWEPPVQPIAVAQRGSAIGGCSGAKWSQPDAAGVPVLVCD